MALSDVPNLLVFTDFHPQGKHVGGVCTRALLKDYPPERVSWCGLRSRFDKEWPDDRYPMLTLPMPRQRRGETLPKAARDLATTLWHIYLALRLAPQYAAQLRAFAQRRGASAVFVILNANPILTYVTAELIALAPELQVKVLVHDPPTRMCPELIAGFSTALRLLIERRLRYVATRCHSLGVCSDGMQDYYRVTYGRDSEVLIHGLPSALFCEPRQGFSGADKLILGFAGSAYPEDLWKRLFADLDAIHWSIDDRQVEIHYAGHPAPWMKSLPQLKMFGWQTQEGTLDILSRCDICYLPYWFDKIHAESAIQCFPTKLPSYVAAGRPILYHGPVQSSPTEFFRTYDAALICNDTRPGGLTRLLQDLVRTPGLVDRLAGESQRAARTRLREDLFVEAFHRLMQAKN